ncbi:14389_t:CDS:2 [Racocetra persica]|uniref:14389_t:CDS:1 n=1 Tax=Racocetra persica TaxID=160502 RepID=A0ACA9KED3_9GLOM|nr:14389_t:CDS:2 [Racocetra persica]
MLIQINTVSLTFDLWTSRAYNSYLGIICYWISDKFCIYDLILDVIEIDAYKTTNDIIGFIEPMLEKFGLEGKKKRKQLREAQLRLERPIKWLTNDLENSNNNDYHHNGANICDKLLSNKEFKVVQALVKLLCLFDKATEILFRSNYAILSIIVPTIKELVYRLNNTNRLRNQFNKLNRSTSQVKNDTSLPKEKAAKETKSAMKNFFSSVW